MALYDILPNVLYNNVHWPAETSRPITMATGGKIVVKAAAETATKTWPSLEDIYEAQYRAAVSRFATRAAFSEYTADYVRDYVPQSQLPVPKYDIMDLVDAAQKELYAQVRGTGAGQSQQLFSELSWPKQKWLLMINSIWWRLAKVFIFAGFGLLCFVMAVGVADKHDIDVREIVLIILQIVIGIMRIVLSLIFWILSKTLAPIINIVRQLEIREKVTTAQEWLDTTYTDLTHNTVSDRINYKRQMMQHWLGHNKLRILFAIFVLHWCITMYQHHGSEQADGTETYDHWDDPRRWQGVRIPAQLARHWAIQDRMYR